jgi:hypothetical protein
MYDQTSLYLRARADRVAIHKTACLSFEWECKATPTTSPYANVSIEALPLINHLRKSEGGILCAYMIRDKSRRDRGFWVDRHYMPRPFKAYVPNRFSRDQRNYFIQQIRQSFGRIELEEIQVRGSGDPFLLFSEREIVALKDWRTVINEQLAKVQNCN